MNTVITNSVIEFNLDSWLEELTIEEPDNSVLQFEEPVEVDYRAELDGM